MVDRDFETMSREVVALRNARRELLASLSVERDNVTRLQAERDRLYLTVNDLRNELNTCTAKIRELNALVAELSNSSHELNR